MQLKLIDIGMAKSVHTLKRQISHASGGVSLDRLWLVYTGIVLIDDLKALKDYDMKAGGVVFVAPSPPK